MWVLVISPKWRRRCVYGTLSGYSCCRVFWHVVACRSLFVAFGVLPACCIDRVLRCCPVLDRTQFLARRWCAENLAFVEDVMR